MEERSEAIRRIPDEWEESPRPCQRTIGRRVEEFDVDCVATSGDGGDDDGEG